MSGIFLKISKINKQKLDRIESELFIIKSEMKRISREIQRIYLSVDELVTPQTGSVKELVEFQARRRVLNTQKDIFTKELHQKDLELAQKQQEYKKAKLEYEKIKYLHEEELKKKLQKIKKDEQKELDEISTMLHKRSRD